MYTHRSAAARRTRRQVVGAGLAGVAASLGAASTTAARSSTALPTVTAPTDSDGREILSFALSVELATRDLYEAAVAERDDAGPGSIFRVLADNHDAYADMLSGELGVQARNQRADEVFDGWLPDFTTTDDQAVANAAYTLEAQLIATYTDAIGTLDDVDAADRLAAITVGEARHCAVLADVAGRSDDLSAVLDTTAAPLATSSDLEVSP